MLKLDYFKLPNYIFAADLTHNEFAVLVYLISLHTIYIVKQAITNEYDKQLLLIPAV